MRHLKWRDQDEGRAVPIPGTIVERIRQHVEQHGTSRVVTGLNRIEGDYLFSNVGGTNILMYSLVDRLWRKAKTAAGITRKITPHWLRHFFASAGLSKGVPVTDMAEWLGHRDPKITYQTYAHVMPDAPQRLRTVMDSVFTLESELTLPLAFEALTEAAQRRGGRPSRDGGAGRAALQARRRRHSRGCLAGGKAMDSGGGVWRCVVTGM
ncbi:tyrosine-type recombinase/integrase [Streptomyces sp. 5.8]|uniref:tyrosine-type recombinase/integrase n=1 Tax=Streptomyces sp. 5.8 TaxID=3406571 RepID=UPI003BB5F5F4